LTADAVARPRAEGVSIQISRPPFYDDEPEMARVVHDPDAGEARLGLHGVLGTRGSFDAAYKYGCASLAST